jgi:hypothetical protein
MILETLVPMPPGADRVTKVGKQIAHAAMGVDMVRIDLQRRFEMNTRLFLLAAHEQQIRQIDVPVRIIRMMVHRLAEQRAGGVLIAGGQSERTEIVQHAEVGGCAAKQFQIVALCFLE